MYHSAESAQNKGQQQTLTERQKRMIRGAVAEIDPAQIAILRRLPVDQRFRQAMSMIRFAERVGAYRLQLREPNLSERESLHIVRSKRMLERKVGTQ